MMESNTENITTHAMRSGFFLGVAYSVLNIFSWIIPSENSFIHAIILLAICFTSFYFIFHYTKLYNTEILNGEITYGKAYSYGIKMFFYASMIAAVTTYFFFRFNPEALTTMRNESAELLSQLTVQDKELSNQIKSQISSYTPKDLTISVLWGYIITGLFLCFFTSFSFIKRKNGETGNIDLTKNENNN